MKEPLKIWKTESYRKMANPTPGEWYRAPILGNEEQAKELGGLVVILPPGKAVPYHYHKNRESILMVLSGEAVELYEDKEYPLQAGDIIFIPAGAKHSVINRTDKEIRFLEIFHASAHGERFHHGRIKKLYGHDVRIQRFPKKIHWIILLLAGRP